MMRAKYECDKCGARFTTDSSLVDNETPLQQRANSYSVINAGNADCNYEHMCDACFAKIPPVFGAVR